MLITEDTFAALVRAFKLSPKWVNPPPLGYEEATKLAWGRELDFAARMNCLGAYSLQEIRPSIVQGFFDGIAHLPGKSASSLSALRQIEKWAVVRDLLPRPITLGVKIVKGSDDGHVPWTDAQVELGERHARPDLASAITLGANTGQRGSDLVRMGPTDLEMFQGIAGINIIQKKTKREVWVPITSRLSAAIATWERRPGPYLTRLDGRAWTRKALTNAWMHERDTNPELRQLRDAGLVLHGLRAHACVRLLREGANTRQIADWVGMSEDMVTRYTRLSRQRENAAAHVFNLERTIRERKSDMSNKNSK